jgi:hypothetical protein
MQRTSLRRVTFGEFGARQSPVSILSKRATAAILKLGH